MKVKKNVTQDEHGEWWYQVPSNKGRVRAQVARCERCGEEFVSYQGSARPGRYCSRSCANRGRFDRGAKSGRWNGGRMVARGYVLIWTPEHPSLAGTKRKYVAEHRLVMEAHLGRYLLPTETVHHKNGIKTDNRLENLELWAVHQPYGQRIEEQRCCACCTGRCRE